MSWKNYLVPPAFQRKTSEVHNLIVRMMGVEPQWSPRKYDVFAKEGYNANVWVFRCIQSIAQGAAGVPWALYRINAEGKKEQVKNHDILKLINKPNEFWSRAEFIENLTAYCLIAGNSYMDMITPTGGDTGPVKELWVYRPDRMSIVTDAKNFVSGYQYSIGIEKVTIPRKRMTHMKYFNPIDDLYGLSPIEVAGRGIDNDNAANAWNNGLLTNGARPGGAWVTEDSLTPAQYENMKSEMDKSYRGAKNAGKPLLLEGGLKWQEMGMNPRDMDFIQSKKFSVLEICAAFGVPPEIVGYGEQKTYSNYQEARKSLYTEGILPMLDKVRDKFNTDLVPRYGEGLFLDYVKDDIDALKESRDAIYKRAGEAYKSEIITRNEARLEMGYGELTEGGDDFYKPPKQVVAPGKETDKEEEGKKGYFFNVKALNIQTDDEKRRFFNAMESGREHFYDDVEAAVKKQFDQERKAVVSAYKNGGYDAALMAIKMQEWQRLYTKLYVDVINAFGTALMEQFKKSVGRDMETKAPLIPLETVFKVFDALVQRFIANTVAKKVVKVTETTKKKIRDLVAKGEAAGESITQIAKRIDSLYLDEIIPNRSRVIARTEVIGASNAGNSLAADQTGLDLIKEWLTTLDGRERDSHHEINGEERPKKETYSNGLMFPGDPNGEPEEVIQCRCTEIYSVVE